MIHIITPTNRWNYVKYLISNLKKMSNGICDVEINLMLNDDDFMDWGHAFKKCASIHNCGIIPKLVDPCYFKANYFFKKNVIIPEDWYGVICDDNMLSSDVFLALKNTEIENKIAIFSELRGTKKVDVNPLILRSEPDKIGIFKTDLCQYFIRGSVFKENLFDDRCNFADGKLIENLVKKHKTKYFSDIYVYFNVLQHGRWDFKIIERLFDV